MKNKENISLIGMPAVGKSTVGNILARRMNYQFVDSDDLICRGEKQTLSQIIAARGLQKFLEIEEKHILNIGCTRHVIATGGSVVYREKAMKHLSDISTIVYLHIDYENLLTRLKELTERGVAITPGKTIEDLYKERTPLYDTWCDLKINCQAMTAEQVSNAALTHFL